MASGPRWAAMTSPAGSMIAPGNDTRHNLTDDNKGGSPRGGTGTKRVPIAQRGGFGHQGRDIGKKPSLSGRSGSGNPASRAGSVGSETAETRIPGHGGSPQGQKNQDIPRQFGKTGQAGVPSYSHANPQAGTGNTSGRSYRLIAGRFKRAAMGAKATGGGGKYGSPPVTSNT